MEFLQTFGDWVAGNESLLSGIAALIAVAGVVASPVLVLMKRRARMSPVTVQPNSTVSASSTLMAPSGTAKRLSYRDLIQPSPFPVEFAKSDGLRIAYNVRGSGEPTIVMAPGIVSHLHVNANLPGFRETYAQLSEHFRLVNFDKRGQGLSDPSTGAPSLEERCRDIEAVMDASTTESAVLLAISEAGPMALQFAYAHPERVRGLILVGTAASWLERGDYPIGLSEKAMDLLYQAWGKGLLRELFFPSTSRDVLDDETYRAMERLLAPRPSIKALIETLKAVDVRPLLPELTQPALVIHFTGDLTVPVRMGRDLAERLPGAEFLEVGSTDHADLSQSPEAIARIRSFCEALR
jgi:pimeloyl-ACP methyl ester carboxylesterase